MHEPSGVPVLYIAGPYTNPDPVENTNATVKFASKLWDSGLAYPMVPHLSMLWHAITPRPVEDWYEIDLAHMLRCDGVIRLPGKSSGSDNEVQFAIEHGLPVFSVASHEWNIVRKTGIAHFIREQVEPFREKRGWQC